MSKSDIVFIIILSLRNFVVVLLVSTLSLYFYSLLVHQLQTPRFTPDSWAYFDLSHSITQNFFYTHYIRQYQFRSSYSISFPPLYPTLVAIVNGIGRFNIFGGVILNSGALIATAASLCFCLQKRGGYGVLGLVIVTALLTTQSYQEELLSARSIPVSLLLLSLFFNLYLQRNWRWSTVIGMGTLTGLLTLNRFDFLLPSLVLLGLIAWQTGKTGYTKATSLVVLAVLYSAVISPWIIYSRQHFSTWFVSDNQRTILAAQSTFLLDYFPVGYEPSTLLENPLLWIVYRLVIASRQALNAFFLFLLQHKMLQMLVVAAGGVLLSKRLMRYSVSQTSPSDHQILTKLALLTPVFLVQLTAISLTGFNENRYAVMTLLYLLLSLVVLVSIQIKTILAPSMSSTALSLFLSLLALSLSWPLLQPVVPTAIQTAAQLSPRLFWSQLQQPPPAYAASVVAQLYHDTPKPILLAHGREKGAVYPAKFATLNKITTLETPSNINASILVDLISTYQVTHVQTACSAWLQTLRANYTITPTPITNVYQISSEKIPAVSSSNTFFSTTADPAFKDCE